MRQLNTCRISKTVTYVTSLPSPGIRAKEQVKEGERTQMSNTQNWTNTVRQAAEAIGAPEATDRIEIALADDLGLTKDDIGLSDLTNESTTPFGDLRASLERNGFKLVQIRKIVAVLRGERKSSEGDRSKNLRTKYGLKEGIKTARLQDLVADYDINEPDDPVSAELKRRFGDAKVIVLDPHAETPTVAIADTLDLMTDYKEGRGLSDKVMIDGLLVEPFAVGEKPHLILEEDPLFVGEALRQNGRSTRGNRIDWSPIKGESRQFVRVAVDIGAIEPESRRDSKDIYLAALDGIKSLEGEFPEVGLEFRKRKQTGDLPKLKVVPGASRKNQPFGVGNRSR